MKEVSREWSNSKLEKYDYYIHMVGEDNNHIVECHTHGLMKTLNHLDLQIVWVPDLTVDMASSILRSLIDLIQDGGRINDNDIIKFKSEDKKMLVAIKAVLEKPIDCNDFVLSRTLLRVIIPDENGSFPWNDGVNPYYKEQYTETDSFINNYIMI